MHVNPAETGISTIGNYPHVCLCSALLESFGGDAGVYVCMCALENVYLNIRIHKDLHFSIYIYTYIFTF